MRESQRKIAIVTDDPGWHGRQLTTSLKEHGFDSQYVSLTDCIIEINGEGKEVYFSRV